jgi:Fe2+ transport system protein FeoA
VLNFWREILLETKLSDLKPGNTATVIKLTGSGAVKRRIADMGITSGARIEMIRNAPLGDPVEFKVRGYLLTLRRSEAEGVIVSTEVQR